MAPRHGWRAGRACAAWAVAIAVLAASVVSVDAARTRVPADLQRGPPWDVPGVPEQYDFLDPDADHRSAGVAFDEVSDMRHAVFAFQSALHFASQDEEANSAGALNDLATALMRVGHYHAAREHYVLALEADPDLQLAEDNLKGLESWMKEHNHIGPNAPVPDAERFATHIADAIEASGFEYQRLSRYPNIWVIPNYLSDEECDEMVELHDRRAAVRDDETVWCLLDEVYSQRIEELGLRVDNNGCTGSKRDNGKLFDPAEGFTERLSTSVLADPLDEPALDRFEARVARELGLYPSHAWNNQLLRYSPGHAYAEHTDCLRPDDDNWQGELPERDRAATLLVYLNDVEDGAGGATKFPRLYPGSDIGVQPKKGTAVVFFSLTPEGRCNFNSAHEAERVTSGHKVVFQRWYHYKPFKWESHSLSQNGHDSIMCDPSRDCRHYMVSPAARRMEAALIRAGERTRDFNPRYMDASTLSDFVDAVEGYPAGGFGQLTAGGAINKYMKRLARETKRGDAMVPRRGDPEFDRTENLARRLHAAADDFVKRAREHDAGLPEEAQRPEVDTLVEQMATRERVARQLGMDVTGGKLGDGGDAAAATLSSDADPEASTPFSEDDGKFDGLDAGAPGGGFWEVEGLDPTYRFDEPLADHASAGMTFDGIGDYDNAERAFRMQLAQARSRATDSEIAAALSDVGTVFMHRQWWTKALGVFEQALAIDPDNEFAKFNRQELVVYLKELESGSYKGASDNVGGGGGGYDGGHDVDSDDDYENDYDDGDVDDDEGEDVMHVGAHAGGTGADEYADSGPREYEAVENLAKGYKFTDPRADHRMAGIAFDEAEKMDLAVRAFRAAVRFADPGEDLSNAHGDLGVALMRSGMHWEAREEYQRALDEWEKNFLAADNLKMMEDWMKEEGLLEPDSRGNLQKVMAPHKRFWENATQALDASGLTYTRASIDPDIRIIENFLTAEECDELIGLHDHVADQEQRADAMWCFEDPERHAKRLRNIGVELGTDPELLADDPDKCTGLPEHNAALFDSDGGYGARLSTSVLISSGQHPATDRLERKVADELGLFPSHGWNNQLLRYHEGHSYAEHTDCLQPENMDFSVGAPETDRVATLLIYLNNVPGGGGETTFPRLGRKGLTVAPKKGTAILWYGYTDEGVCNLDTTHAALKVRGGVKYAFQKWFHHKPFRMGYHPKSIDSVWCDPKDCRYYITAPENREQGDVVWQLQQQTKDFHEAGWEDIVQVVDALEGFPPQGAVQTLVAKAYNERLNILARRFRKKIKSFLPTQEELDDVAAVGRRVSRINREYIEHFEALDEGLPFVRPFVDDLKAALREREARAEALGIDATSEDESMAGKPSWYASARSYALPIPEPGAVDSFDAAAAAAERAARAARVREQSDVLQKAKPKGKGKDYFIRPVAVDGEFEDEYYDVGADGSVHSSGEGGRSSGGGGRGGDGGGGGGGGPSGGPSGHRRAPGSDGAYDPRDPDADHTAAGMEFDAAGDYESAVEAFDRALAAAKRDGTRIDVANALNDLGTVRMHQQRWRDALAMFSKALAADATNDVAADNKRELEAYLAAQGAGDGGGVQLTAAEEGAATLLKGLGMLDAGTVDALVEAASGSPVAEDECDAIDDTLADARDAAREAAACKGLRRAGGAAARHLRLCVDAIVEAGVGGAAAADATRKASDAAAVIKSACR